MMKRKHRSKAEWQKLIEQQAQSGLAFCEQQGLLRKTFYRHRKLRTQKGTGRTVGQFIQV